MIDQWPLRGAAHGLHLPDPGGIDVGRDGLPLNGRPRQGASDPLSQTIDTEVGPLVARVGETLLYQYPEGDADRVVLVEVSPRVVVRFPVGTTERVRAVDPAFLISLREDA